MGFKNRKYFWRVHFCEDPESTKYQGQQMEFRNQTVLSNRINTIFTQEARIISKLVKRDE